jgi:hypothetical protein
MKSTNYHVASEDHWGGSNSQADFNIEGNLNNQTDKSIIALNKTLPLSEMNAATSKPIEVKTP